MSWLDYLWQTYERFCQGLVRIPMTESVIGMCSGGAQGQLLGRGWGKREAARMWARHTLGLAGNGSPKRRARPRLGRDARRARAAYLRRLAKLGL